jgi:parallel beta-helix repeat protein
VNVATNGLDVTLEGLTVTGGRRGVQVNGGSATSLTLRGVTVEKNGAGKGNDFGLRVTGDVKVFLSGTTIGRNDGDGTTVAHGRASIQIDQSTVAGNYLYGIILQDASETSITSSQITGTRANADGGGGFGLYLKGTAKATARACTLSGNRYGIYLVGDSSAEVTSSTVSGAARYGIRVRDSAALTLVDTRVAGGTGDGSNTYNYGSGIILGDTCTATLRSCTIESNYMYGLDISGSAQTTITGGAVRGNAYQGVNIAGTAHVEISGCSISGTKQRPAPTACCGSGVVVYDASTVEVSGCTITENAEAGVWIGKDGTVSVSGCTLSGNQFCGIVFTGSSDGTVDGTTISDNFVEGILVEDDARAEITNNRITGTKPRTGFETWGVGVNLLGGVATLKGNTISNNTTDGILLQEAFQATITGNTITGNQRCGVNVFSPSVTITGQGNTISGNRKGQLCGSTSKIPNGFGGGK